MNSDAVELSRKVRFQVEDIGIFADNRFWFPDHTVKVPFKVRMHKNNKKYKGLSP